MLRVPKISSKPNEVSVPLSLQPLLQLFGSTPIQNDSILFKDGRRLRGVKTKRLGLYGVSSDEEAPPPSSSLSAECQSISWTQSFMFSPRLSFFDFHVDVISKLCLWLSLFVFDWPTQRVGFF